MEEYRKAQQLKAKSGPTAIDVSVRPTFSPFRAAAVAPARSATALPTLFANEIHLSERDLAHRHGCSVKKLQADRLKGVGIPYVKLGRLVRYRLSDVLAYEDAHLRSSTSEGELS